MNDEYATAQKREADEQGVLDDVDQMVRNSGQHLPEISKPNIDFGVEVVAENASSHKAAKKKKKKKVKKQIGANDLDHQLQNEINRLSSEKDDFEFTVIGAENDAHN